MRPIPLIVGLVFGLFLPASIASAGELISGKDSRAEPFKKAVAALVKEISAGSLDKAQAAYAGDGADLELLKAYVDGVAAARAMRAAVDSKFGADPSRMLRGLDEGVARMGVKDFNSVIFDDDPDLASSSADSPLGVGIEFKKVKGEWKVRSLASLPNTPEKHIRILKDYIRSVTAITAKIKSGGYGAVDDAIDAAKEAESQLWPRK